MKNNFYARSSLKLFDVMKLTPAAVAAFLASMTQPTLAAPRMPHTKTDIIMPWNLNDALEGSVLAAAWSSNASGKLERQTWVNPDHIKAHLANIELRRSGTTTKASTTNRTTSTQSTTTAAADEPRWHGAPRPGSHMASPNKPPRFDI